MHRLREAMRTGGLEPLGGKGKVVEADETYFGKAETMHVSKQRKGRPYTKKGHFMNNRPILALVERGGSVRSFHVAVADQATVCNIVRENVDSESKVHTDESKLYSKPLMGVLRHRRVKHTAGEYVRGDVTTNTVESYFSIFKRGMRGTYQHCAEKHLHRYLAEFDFRHNNRIALGVNDTMRAETLAEGIVGKRLTYRRPNSASLSS
jgi:hypothetical protein